MKKLKLGILGVGAIGAMLSYFLLKNADLELSFYNRSPRPFLKIKNNGVTSKTSISCLTEVQQEQKLDWLVVCLKEYQFVDAGVFLGKLISEGTRVAVIRNGLRLKAPVLRYTSEDNILECIIDAPCQPDEEQYYTIFRTPKITIPESALATSFSTLFPQEEVHINIIKDFKTESWKKLCESAALGAILCLSGETCWIFKDPEIRNLYKNILAEAIEVAKADDAVIEDAFVNEMLEKVVNYPESKGSSMLTDRLKGRPIELGAKNGIISSLAKQYAIPTPINDLICVLLKHTNNS